MRIRVLRASCLCIIVLTACVCSPAAAQSPPATVWHNQLPEYHRSGVMPAAAGMHTDSLTINELSFLFMNNGFLSNTEEWAGGLRWPKQQGPVLMFMEGFLYGGKTASQNYLGGSTYRTGLRPGHLGPDGQPGDIADPRGRIFHARAMTRTEFAALPPAVQTQLRKDFMEWPADLGAPWVDGNRNGRYDPDFDLWLDTGTYVDHPMLPGDETCWYVCNDRDPDVLRALAGSTPIGLEVQFQHWAYRGTGPLSRTIFSRAVLINKGNDAIPDFTIGRWADPDLGDPFDDAVGVDTLRDMMYVWNGRNTDSRFEHLPGGGNPPALGVVLLQGPAIPDPTGTIMRDFRPRHGFRAARLSSFAFFINADPDFRDPDLGSPAGAEEWLNYMGGTFWNRRPYVDPVSGDTVRICLAGDPVTGFGWIDGVHHSFGDRRMAMFAEPVPFRPGDTLEVVFATVLAQDETVTRDITQLRTDADMIRSVFSTWRYGTALPALTSRVSYPDASTAMVHTSGVLPYADSAAAIVRRDDGTTVGTFQLFDDGAHGDGTAGDGIFGGFWQTGRAPAGVDVHVSATYPDGGSASWSAGRCLPLAGPVRASFERLLSGHLNDDGRMNPGEDVRFSLLLSNNTPVELSWLSITPVPNAAVTSATRVNVRTPIPPGGSASTLADANGSMQARIADAVPDGTQLLLPVDIADMENNCWCDTLRMDVRARRDVTFDGLLEHVRGPGTGSLGWRLMDYGALRPHRYRVTVHGGPFDTKRALSIQNITTGVSVANRVPVPDSLGLELPVIDGWRLHLGTASTGTVNRSSLMPATTLTITASPAGGRALTASPVTSVYGNLLSTENLATWRDPLPIRIDFSPSTAGSAYRFIRGSFPNYGYDGYVDVPFAVWDVRDTLAPRRIAAGFIERSTSARRNGNWDPIVSGDPEYLLIFSTDYTDSADPQYIGKSIQYQSAALGVLYTLDIRHLTDSSRIEEGSSIHITPRIPMTEEDEYLLIPKRQLNPGSEDVPYGDIVAAFHGGIVVARAGQAVRLGLKDAEAGLIRVRMTDLLGRDLGEAFRAERVSGTGSIDFLPPPGLRPGTYLLRITGEGTERAVRLLLLR